MSNWQLNRYFRRLLIFGLKFILLGWIPSVLEAQNSPIDWNKQGISEINRDTLLPIARDNFGRRKIVWLADEGARGLDRPLRGASLAGPEEANFLQEFVRVEFNSEKELNGFCLIGPGDKVNDRGQIRVGDLFGWVPASHLIVENAPLRTGVKAVTYKKLRVVVSQNAIDDALNSENQDILKVIPIRSLSRKSETPVDQPLDYEAFYFVFGETESTFDDRKYVLAGKSIVFNIKEPQIDILGWVPVDRTSLWSSALGYEWHAESTAEDWPRINNNFSGRRENPGFVFSFYSRNPETGQLFFDETKSKDAAFKYLQHIRTGKSHQSFLEELGQDNEGIFRLQENFDENGCSVHFRPEDWRMPILETNVAQWNDFRLEKVGWEGKSDDQKMKEELRSEIAVLIKKLSNLDVLFVIDRTESMAATFPEVVISICRLIRNLINSQLEGNESPNLRIAVSFFGSASEDENSRFDLDKLKAVVSAENNSETRLKAAITFLDRIIAEYESKPDRISSQDLQRKLRLVVDQASSDTKNDPIWKLIDRILTTPARGDEILHEEVFEGLKASIDNAGFPRSSDTSVQLVVLIGDAGDISWHPSRKLSANERFEIVRRTSRMIWDSQNTDRMFLSVQFINPAVPQSEYAENGYGDFADQMSMIMTEGSSILAKNWNENGTSIIAESTADLERSVSDFVGRIDGKLKETRNTLDNIQEKGFHTTALSSEELVNLEQIRGKEFVERLKSVLNSLPPIYVEGFIWSNSLEKKASGRVELYPLVQERVLISRELLFKLKSDLGNFIEPIGRDQSSSLKQVAEKLLQNYFKEDNEQVMQLKNLGDIWKQIYDLPATSSGSELFSLTLKELENWENQFGKLLQKERDRDLTGEESEKLEKMRITLKQLIVSYERLKDVLEGIRYEVYTAENSDDGFFKVRRSGKKENIIWKTRAGFSMSGDSLPGSAQQTEQWIWLELENGLPK